MTGGKKGLCHKRDQTIKDMSGWKRVYVIRQYKT